MFIVLLRLPVSKHQDCYRLALFETHNRTSTVLSLKHWFICTKNQQKKHAKNIRISDPQRLYLAQPQTQPIFPQLQLYPLFTVVIILVAKQMQPNLCLCYLFAESAEEQDQSADNFLIIFY